MMDEEELARLKQEAADNEARALEAVGENERLRAELAAATDAAASLDADISAMRGEIDEREAALRKAAERYRELILESDPTLPPDLITGDTIDEVEASAQRARELASRVRSRIESETYAARVPAGAPPRTTTDVSAMTPEQKIRYGLAQRERQ